MCETLGRTFGRIGSSASFKWVLFFPALAKRSSPDDDFISSISECSGWCLVACHPQQLFTTRFLHSLILDLIDKHCIKKETLCVFDDESDALACELLVMYGRMASILSVVTVGL